jgi:dienelactone hydrolase
MTHSVGKCAITGFFALALCIPGAAQQAVEARLTRAADLLQMFLDGKYKEFCAAGDETVRAKLTPQLCMQIQARLRFQLGRYQSFEREKHEVIQGNYAVPFNCRYEQGTCVLRVVVNAKDELVGFFMTQMTPNPPYEPPDYVKKSAFREVKFTVKDDEFELPGTLSLPNTVGKHPAVVLVHGSGPHDEDESVSANKPFRDLAWGLASQGIAVLRYEKRTHKYPTAIPPADITLEWETINDAVAAAAMLRDHGDIDPKRVYVLGHSLGGMAAPYIAQKDGKLAGIIIMAGNSRSILDVMDEQYEYLAGADGSVTPEERAQVNEIHTAFALIREEKPVPDEMKDGVQLPESYLLDLHKRRQVEVASKLNTRILVLHGARDYQVTIADYEGWKKGLAEYKHAEFRLYDDLNHLMMSGEGKSRPEEYGVAGHVDRTVVEDIAKWINAENGEH